MKEGMFECVESKYERLLLKRPSIKTPLTDGFLPLVENNKSRGNDHGKSHHIIPL